MNKENYDELIKILCKLEEQGIDTNEIIRELEKGCL